jgi:hypothetical protein
MSLTSAFQKISTFLSRNKTTEIPRDTLAKIIYPLTSFQGDEFQTSNEDLVKKYRDLSDWVRIGFHHEKPKGELYDDLQKGLERLIHTISQADEESDTIAVDRQHMDLIKDGFCQINYAAHNLELSAKHQNKAQIIADKHGNDLLVPIIQIYNRPNESHQMAAYKLREISSYLGDYFQGRPVNPPMMKLVP